MNCTLPKACALRSAMAASLSAAVLLSQAEAAAAHPQ